MNFKFILQNESDDDDLPEAFELDASAVKPPVDAMSTVASSDDEVNIISYKRFHRLPPEPMTSYLWSSAKLIITYPEQVKPTNKTIAILVFFRIVFCAYTM